MITLQDIVGRSQRADVVRARNAYCYQLWRQHPTMTLREIGKRVGGWVPSTIYHAIEQARKREEHVPSSPVREKKIVRNVIPLGHWPW